MRWYPGYLLPCVQTPLICCLVERFRPYGGSLLAADAPKVSKRSCPLHPGLAALDLIRFAHPAGQPSAVTALRSVSSLHHCSRGTPRWAIPGPSRLSRHPCRSTPCATIPLGLLMGRLASSVRLRIEKTKHVMAMVVMDVLNIPVDKLRVIHLHPVYR